MLFRKLLRTFSLDQLYCINIAHNLSPYSTPIRPSDKETPPQPITTTCHSKLKDQSTLEIHSLSETVVYLIPLIWNWMEMPVVASGKSLGLSLLCTDRLLWDFFFKFFVYISRPVHLGSIIKCWHVRLVNPETNIESLEFLDVVIYSIGPQKVSLSGLGSITEQCHFSSLNVPPSKYYWTLHRTNQTLIFLYITFCLDIQKYRVLDGLLPQGVIGILQSVDHLVQIF